MGRLDASVRDAFRFFAWYLTNGTLGGTDVWGNDEQHWYTELLLESPGTYENTWSVFVSGLTVDDSGALNRHPEDAYDRAAQFLRAQVDPRYVAEPAFDAAEIDPRLPRPDARRQGRGLHTTVRVATRDFAGALRHGRLVALAGIAYVETLAERPSLMESVWSIFVNVLDIDDAGAAVTPLHAMDRAAQFLGEACGGPEAVPPWASWEIEPPFV
ncbi:DUF7677 family protein [Embleya hyalina]|uniref:DUF7677 domain-containing protein n=1 Tax=Embleya hyalina TaxID=516124 RepID=A0A401Z5X3_9ACTN|nr:hypothetical protein [Embleya hyalina]GCE02229.1 hypothetical protein EHYA_10006 [Embleya hyalina]